MNAPAPVAVGYVSASDDGELDQQRATVTDYARTEGYALAQIVTDRFDGYTISQVLDAARRHEARLVTIPAATTLATAYALIAHELEPIGAACVVIGDTPEARDGPTATHEPATTAVEPGTPTAALRPTGALGRHALPHTPRHAARTTR
ncbi:hypothetical protein GCM10027059_21170 [Myceligenerans halotolerans]